MKEKTLLNVEGMTCSNCALGVTRMLEKKGLKEIRVDFTSGEVSFEEVETEKGGKQEEELSSWFVVASSASCADVHVAIVWNIACVRISRIFTNH